MYVIQLCRLLKKIVFAILNIGTTISWIFRFFVSLCCFYSFQVIEKDPNKAVPLFWAAINSGDRIESALKDMANVLKQANRAEEAIEAIRSFRDRCPYEAQESLDNILLDLYKVSLSYFKEKG